MIHIPNKCSTFRDLPFLGYSCMQAKIDEFWTKTHVMVGFLYTILFIITHTTR